MEKRLKQSDQELKNQRFLLMLPFLIVPFAGIFFWLLGGGPGIKQSASDTPITGINLSLPEAKKKEMPTTKLVLYQNAEKDSARINELLKQDPYSKSFLHSEDEHLIPYEPIEGTGDGLQYGYIDPNEKKVYDRINILNKSLNDAESYQRLGMETDDLKGVDPELLGLREDMKKLESMMNRQYESNSLAGDGEMSEINGMLEKVLDIQHPERVKERIKTSSEQNRGVVYTVSATRHHIPINELASLKNDSIESNIDRSRLFFGLQENFDDGTDKTAIQAAVHETQVLMSGATIKLRLLQDVFVNGILVIKGQFVYGKVNLSGERLLVEVESFNCNNNLLPVNLSAYDLDGLPGIRIPGSISRDVLKQNSDQALAGMNNIGMFNPSLGAQAASAGISIGQNLLSKKIKLVKVEVKAGYRILLQDNNREK